MPDEHPPSDRDAWRRAAEEAVAQLESIEGAINILEREATKVRAILKALQIRTAHK